MSVEYETVPGQWLVTLRHYATDEMRSNHISLVESKTSDPTRFSVDIQVKFDLPHLFGYAAAFDETTKTELEGLPEVAAIEPLYIYRHCFVQTEAPWGLARTSTRTRLPTTGPYIYNYVDTGEGTTVYVIDTGIKDTHLEFDGRASKGPKFVTSPTPISDDDKSGHGTHVAGTIAGKTYGVAKKAKVVGIKVFNDAPRPGALTSDIIKALEWVLEEYRKTGKSSVVNMSLSGGPSDALDRAVAAVVQGGVTVVVAAGNQSFDAQNQSPAREPLAITVGATDINDAAAPFSNFGKMIDIFAPGVNILSAWIGDDTATRTISGTSMGMHFSSHSGETLKI
ncbi:putative alkaline serine protease [Achaetomium macrosporum]|uniref:Alkaline serine protease n=1 Tax=Achaetomium macrosporum TaxID=79813 RepID=A0AAN7BZX9_9PEZI|nr:putative alkaline serine protease [Achaetomium macrosporum]